MPAFVLVHSPLVGPLTWVPVAEELRRMGVSAIAPPLPDAREVGPPYWMRHAEAVAQAMKELPAGEPLILVGHSGAGMLLPAIREVSKRPVAGYIFVDAGVPHDGMSRLDFFEGEEANAFRERATGGFIPTWSEDDLAEVIPDAEMRHRFVGELTPLPLAVYEEPLPVFEGWPDAPCGYLQFSPFYAPYAEQARREGWAYRRLEGGHFHMLVEPKAVANALVEIARQTGAITAGG